MFGTVGASCLSVREEIRMRNGCGRMDQSGKKATARSTRSTTLPPTASATYGQGRRRRLLQLGDCVGPLLYSMLAPWPQALEALSARDVKRPSLAPQKSIIAWRSLQPSAYDAPCQQWLKSSNNDYCQDSSGSGWSPDTDEVNLL